MNRTLPPGDRGNRSAAPSGTSGDRGAVPGAIGLVRGTAHAEVAAGPEGIAHVARTLADVRFAGDVWLCAPTPERVGPQSEKARRGRSRAGVEAEPHLLGDAVEAGPVLAFGGLDLQSHL